MGDAAGAGCGQGEGEGGGAILVGGSVCALDSASRWIPSELLQGSAGGSHAASRLPNAEACLRRSEPRHHPIKLALPQSLR